MCLNSQSSGSAEERARNAQIEKNLASTKAELANHIKLLLLGAGESGKSTIAKQMKIIHLDGFNDEERLEMKSIIFNNVMYNMKCLIEGAQLLGFAFDGENKERAEKFLEEDYFGGELTEPIAEDIRILWKDSGVQQAFQNSHKFQLNDSAEYYFSEIDRLANPNYIPNTQDVLRSRAKTTGIIETDFKVNDIRFTLVDVGGQRSERRKWMHCFQDVTAVIFCVALSGYDLKLYEDDETNRMHEALRLFKDICNTKWFEDTAIILFLNKKDLFEKKITKSPLTTCFPEYTGENTYDKAVEFIEDKFMAQNDNPKKLIYPHKTCATDTENITVVFRAVQDILLNKVLERLNV